MLNFDKTGKIYLGSYFGKGIVHNNILVIGYTGWKGFQSFGRGVVICDVDTQVTHSTITNLDKLLRI